MTDNIFVTLVYEEDIIAGDHVIAVYKNADDADHDFPWNYKETKFLNTKPRNQTPEEG